MNPANSPENRDTFFARLRPLLAPSDLLKVEVAYALAKHAHRAQSRKEVDADGRPIRYFEHLRATALIMIDELGVHDTDMVISCLMHDAIEDTNDISDRMLEHLFGADVARTVKLLTKEPGAKEGYFARLIRHGNTRVWMVKGCDRLSNLRTLRQCSAEFVTKQLKETRAHIYPMLNLLVAAAETTEYKMPARNLRELIHAETESE